MSRQLKRVKILYFLATMLGITLLTSSIFFAYLIKDLPDISTFDSRKIVQSSKIFDRTGTILLYELHGEEKRTIIPFEQIPALAKQATIAIEDSTFYNHSALDLKSLIRAVIVNLKQGRLAQGGSTITQQLAKNAFLTSEKTFTRKLKELVLAYALENKYSKDEILNLYLNQIPYGSNSYGLEAASKTYFSKSINELSLSQITILASLPRAPSYYSPYGIHKEDLLKRQKIVLEKMFFLGYITKDELLKSQFEKLEFQEQTTEIKAPHFTFSVIDYLNNTYGEDFIRTGGLKITTTLNWDLQQIAERTVANGAMRNEELYQGKNAALVAQDSTTGQVIALVGSRNYFDQEIDGNFNVATQGLRQPGSAIKPFAYLAAFKKGYTPDTTILDLETEFDTTGEPEKSYIPKNYDETFVGPISMKEALAQSRNVPAVKTLYLVGIDNLLKIVRDFGITTLTERSRYGLSLVLGGGEVKLIDLIGAYSVLSQEGQKHKQTFILKIEDSNGKILESYNDSTSIVIDAQYPRLINNILSDGELRKSLFQSSFSLTTFENHEVALKTGTTNDYRDAWAIGYTPNLVVGVWAGNNDNTPMVRRGSSILAAVPIWSAFMQEALKTTAETTFTKPEIITITKPILKGEFIIDNQLHDILYYVDKNDPAGPTPTNPDEDGQFKNWEDPITKWLETHPISAIIAQKTATEATTSASDSSIMSIDILSPKNGEFIQNYFTVNLKIKSSNGLQKIELYLNNASIENNTNTSFEHNLDEYFYSTVIPSTKTDSQNLLKIKAMDTRGNTIEKSIILFR